MAKISKTRSEKASLYICTDYYKEEKIGAHYN